MKLWKYCRCTNNLHKRSYFNAEKLRQTSEENEKAPEESEIQAVEKILTVIFHGWFFFFLRYKLFQVPMETLEGILKN